MDLPPPQSSRCNNGNSVSESNESTARYVVELTRELQSDLRFRCASHDEEQQRAASRRRSGEEKRRLAFVWRCQAVFGEAKKEPFVRSSLPSRCFVAASSSCHALLHRLSPSISRKHIPSLTLS